MTLIELLLRANDGYEGNGEGFTLRPWFTAEGKLRRKADRSDLLAQFILTELIQTFDAEARAEDQLETASQVLDNAAKDLGLVCDALLDLDEYNSHYKSHWLLVEIQNQRKFRP